MDPMRIDGTFHMENELKILMAIKTIISQMKIKKGAIYVKQTVPKKMRTAT